MKNNYVIRELASLERSIRKYFDHSPVKREVESVTGTHGWIIVYLAGKDGEDVYQRDLEREFNITRSTTSKMLANMEKNDLIGREKVARDDRLKKIVLTEKSKKLAEKIRLDNMAMEKRLTKGFSDEEIETMLKFVHRMRENIEDQ